MDALNFSGPIVVKACKEYIGEKTKRKGMFRLDPEIHKALVEQKGFYLFQLEKADHTTLLKVVPADKVEFKDNITWTSFFCTVC